MRGRGWDEDDEETGRQVVAEDEASGAQAPTEDRAVL